ncbi:MAG: hybrid sensor histidine kinase/response regulator [Isosphaera sp.]|nr:hybrid sensor histidine kinase/response regulator [Isosphaera sp.]
MSNPGASLFDLFREEVRSHADTLTRGLLDAEADPANPSRVEPLMRAAHSIKGAARIVGIDAAVRLAHVMEDALVAAQTGKVRLTPADIDDLLKGTDLLAKLADLTPETADGWGAAHGPAVAALEPAFAAMAAGKPRAAAPATPPAAPPAPDDPFPPPPPFTPAQLPHDPLPLPPDHSMHDLFREELRWHLRVVAGGELDASLESLKQIRGAARVVKCVPVERAAAGLGAFLQAVREGRTTASPRAGDWARAAVAALAGAVGTDEESFPTWLAAATPTLAQVADIFERAARSSPSPPQGERVASGVSREPGEGGGANGRPGTPAPPPGPALRASPPPPPKGGEGEDPAALVPARPPEQPVAPSPAAQSEAVVRVTARSLNRLMGLAGESLVQARWLPSFSTALLALRKHHDRLAALIDESYQAAAAGAAADHLATVLADARREAAACRLALTDQAAEFDDHAARAEDLNARLYREVITSRMRPFADGVHGLPRLVRDMARALGKEVRLVIEGEGTEVDRDVLERLEAPLSHLIRNAVDHGVEMPDARVRVGKPAGGIVRLEARHRAGMLQVTVSDDGGGVDPERLRRKVVDRGLNTAEVAARLTEPELLEFLFLPGFSTAAAVTEFSGRGVGLDVVQDTVRKVGGSVRVTTRAGRGTTFHLQLPLTLSVIRAVVVEVAGEPYAFPHTRIDRLVRVPRTGVRSLEHRQFVSVDGQNVGLVVAAQLLDLPGGPPPDDDLAVVLLSDASGVYGLVVDAFRGEQDLVVRPLDPRLGKVPNLSAAAILDDGSPVLIVDAEDLVRSMDQYIQAGALARCDVRAAGPARKKRVLVVDDSITVREVERQLLLHKGYEVAVAVDGVDGWNKVRAEPFDLLVSDVDMPRMSGLQLVAAVRADPNLRELPVVIVSYKEREEDRVRGLEVGANCYLTKSSFHDNRFAEAVEDLIGPA